MFKEVDNFYPTPEKLIDRMLIEVDFNKISTVLEPSAGTGNIAEAVLNKFKAHYISYYGRDKKYDIDCIEINENLQHVLKGKGFRVVHDDFLTYHTAKRYDLIVMNPPFIDGDKHLLKALEMQQYGGKVICLLNAETIKNPYSNIRKDLIAKLNKYNTNIRYIKDAFKNAENKTDVEIALITVDIPQSKKESIIIEHLKKEEQYRERRHENNSLVYGDFIERIIQHYNYEIKAGETLINEYLNISPLIPSGFKEEYENAPILNLIVTGSDKYGGGSLINTYVKAVRMKYWKALFTSEEFTKLLTNNLRNEYINKVNELSDYDFSYYNIKQIQIDVNKYMIQSVENTILKLFDDFSIAYYWDVNTANNIHYYNGWATNKAWYINKKVIIPLQAFEDMQYSWGRYRPTSYKVKDRLQDIEKVFNYLDGGKIQSDIVLENVLKEAEKTETTKNIHCKYFDITFYKKGTCHITFTNDELLKKFNIFGSQKKGWLPPSYGKVAYEDMNKEEQKVIDEFEGKEAYKNVIRNRKYYIYNPSDILLIG